VTQIALSRYSYKDDGKSIVKTGCLLGDWTDEVDKNVCITDWISTGPKRYCYKTNTGKIKKKNTLKYKTSKKINSDRQPK
jgi:hypothetical protein